MNVSPPPIPVALEKPVPSYMVPAVLLSLCGCPPVGLAAIVFASQVVARQNRGDLAGAQQASRRARLFCWIAFVLMAIFWLCESAVIRSILGT